MFIALEYLKMPSEVLDAYRNWLRRDRGLVRPGAAKLLTGVESSRIRDIIWHVSSPIVTTRIEVGLVK